MQHYRTYNALHRDQHAGVLIPGQQRVLPVLRLRVLNVRPPAHEVLVAHYLGQLARDGAVDVFGRVEVGRKEDVEISLMDLMRSQYPGSRVARGNLQMAS